MRLFIDYGITLCLLILLLSCATPQITKDTVINEDEGIVITKVKTNTKNIEILIYSEENKLMPLQATLTSSDLEYLRVFKLVGGKYDIGRIIRNRCYAILEERYFNIEPGTINYIGDIKINWETSSWHCGYSQTVTIDNEKSINEAKKKYPWLFEKYPYRKSIPAVEIETVEGFEKVDELNKMKENQQKDINGESKK